ncbi:MAG: PAS domain S-box protein [Gaiellales bacterium]
MGPESTHEILEVIARHMPEVAWAADPVTRTTIFVSEAASQQYGLPPSHFIGHGIDRFRTIVHPDDLATFEDAVTSQTAGSLEYTVRIVRPSGEVRWLLSRSFAVNGAHGTVELIVGTSVDITAQKAAERRFRDLVEQLPLAMYLAERTAGLPPVYVNPTIEALVGFTPEEWVRDRPFWSLVDPRDLELVRSVDQQLQASDEPVGATYRLRRRDGGTIWVQDHAVAVRDANDELTLVQGFLLDITETVEITEELRDSEARSRAFVQTAWDAFVTHQDGIVTAVEGGFDEISGRPNEMTVGMRILDLVAEHERPRIATRMRDLDTSVAEIDVLHTDGSVVPVEVVTRNIEVDGAVTRQIAVRDIRDRRRAEAALAEAESRARHAQKLEAVGRLAGGIAHDFNNLLMAISGYADIILDSLPDGSPLRDDATEIRATASRGAELTRQLLAFSRRQVMEQQVLALPAVVADAAALLERLVGDQVRIVTDLDPATPAILGNRGELDQVLANLVVNARDAMPQGGTVEITTRPLHVGPAASRGLLPGDYAILTVADNGTGMDEATRAQIFEPYFTTKEPGKGTGLGLATVYGIVTQLDGAVEVETEPGKGTTFTLAFPATTEQATAKTEEPEGPITPSTNERAEEQVLLVEDQESVRRMLARLVTGLGYRVDTAADGEEALRALAGGARYRLLITDVLMPGMGGPELVARARASHPELPVLFISGFTTDELLDPAGLPPRTAFLPKPFSRAALAAEINAIVDE